MSFDLPACAGAGGPLPALVAAPLVGGSSFETQPPAVVYQTSLLADQGRQDGSTPLLLSLRLADDAAASLTAHLLHAPLASLVYGAIRRVDLRELERFDAASGKMLGVRMSQSIFAFDFRTSSSTLTIQLHRKELPVSTNYGDAPFVLSVLLKPCGEVVVSSPFVVASKEAPPRDPRPPPKRVRAPSARLPTLAPALGDEALITQHCKALKRGRVGAAPGDASPVKAGAAPAPAPAAAVPAAADDLAFPTNVFFDDGCDNLAFYDLLS